VLYQHYSLTLELKNEQIQFAYLAEALQHPPKILTGQSISTDMTKHHLQKEALDKLGLWNFAWRGCI
jgi:hypothetical protein